MPIRCPYWSFCLSLVALPLLMAGEPPRPPAGVVQKDQVVAGSANDSMEVRHLVLKGSNEEIGRALATIARDRYQAKPQASQDSPRTRAQRRYIERNYPILYERMRGAASAFGGRLEDDAWNWSEFGFTDLRPGCSVMYLPPHATAIGSGVVSRDYDFTTGSLGFGFLEPGMLHPTARPYVVEMHPDRGYASLALVSYELLSGVLDGINSEGLTVTLAMDDEVFSTQAIDPTRGPSAGLGELQTLRILLDTCGNVAEAKEALLLAKQYYAFVPVHYLIADRFGNSFIWEYSQFRNREYILEDPSKPLVMTNFTLHRRSTDGRPPTAEQAKAVCRRYCSLTEDLAQGGAMSLERIKQAHRKVDAELPKTADPSRPPVRTLWHSLYYPEQRRLEVSFYLRDEEVPGRPDKVKIARSQYVEFRLEPTESAKAPATEPIAPATAGRAAPATLTPAVEEVVAALERAGGKAKVDDARVVAVSLDKVSDPDPLLPLLRKLPDLEELTIRNKKFDDPSMAQLEGLPKLATLIVSLSSVGDDGLKTLETLPRLRTFQATSTKITDSGLVHLQDLVGLEVLVLGGNDITDAGVARLAKLKSLTGLFLNSTKLTDAGLDHLRGMSRMTKLNLSNTAVTDAGVASLKKALPFYAMIIRERAPSK
jgi:hypothetical protein